MPYRIVGSRPFSSDPPRDQGPPRGLKPIETSYRGCRFRSRLEARWAVFFDQIGTEWVYESQGYVLNGMPYLPDFWLPYAPMKEEGWGFWVEIKPVPLVPDQVHFFGELARLSGHRTFVICGQPWPGEHRIYVFQHHHGTVPDNPIVVGELGFRDCYLGASTLRDMMELNVLSDDGTGGWFPFVEGYSFWANGGPEGLHRAFSLARSARFEHGETPGGGRG